MKIFVLEDNSERIKMFSLILLNQEFVICNNANDAMMVLSNRKFDRIFLDHDLGGMTFVDDSKCNNTGRHVTKLMHTTKNKDTDIVIHSWNDNGVKNMVSDLKHHKHGGNVIVLMYDTQEFMDYLTRLKDLK